VSRGVIKSLILSVGLLFLAYVAIFFTWESSKLRNWASHGVMDTKLRAVDSQSWIFADVDTSEFTGLFIPSDGDTLIAIDDTLRTYDQIRQFVTQHHHADEDFRVTYSHFSRERSSTITMDTVSASRALPFILLGVLRLLIILSFIGVGLWAYQRRSESVGVRVLTLFCYSMAAFPLTMFTMFSADMASFAIPNHNTITRILRITMIFAGGLWLNLHLVFPRVSRFLLRLRRWGYLLIYSPQIAVAIWAIATGTNVVNDHPRMMITIILVQFWLGSLLLSRHHKNARSLLERRQTKLVLRGSGFGVTALTFLLIVATYLSEWFTGLPMTAQLIFTNLGFLALLLTPLSLAYAFGRYRLLEVEGKLQRGTRHVIVTAILLLIFFLMVYGIGQLLVTQLGITSSTPILLLAMTLALGVSPAQRWLQDWLERKFYPERHQLRVMIEDLAQRIGSFPDRDTLFQQLEERLREALGVSKAIAVLKEPNGSFRGHDGSTTPFSDDNDLLTHLERTARPVLLDEAMASLRIPFTDGQMFWIRKNEINLVIPMFARLRLIGFLALGRTTRGSDYTPEGIEVLLGLTNQIALASENLRLLEDNLEKRRLEEQLVLAREIQQGFLPRVIPKTEKLDIAARSHFCFEVAGDYYDVIALKNGRTLLAVGDVSGKGAGAALIMANLQASLRICAALELEPVKIVEHTNALIYSNTPVEQYITFFIAIFDPKTRNLTYVNAGHNPPLLFDVKGRTRELSEGGMILGIDPKGKYLQGKVKCSVGCKILLYTDGVTETQSPGGEEFGIVRLKQMMNATATRTPDQSLEALEGEVSRFRAKKVLEDDSTLLLAKVL